MSDKKASQKYRKAVATIFFRKLEAQGECCLKNRESALVKE